MSNLHVFFLLVFFGFCLHASCRPCTIVHGLHMTHSKTSSLFGSFAATYRYPHTSSSRTAMLSITFLRSFGLAVPLVLSDGNRMYGLAQKRVQGLGSGFQDLSKMWDLKLGGPDTRRQTLSCQPCLTLMSSFHCTYISRPVSQANRLRKSSRFAMTKCVDTCKLLRSCQNPEEVSNVSYVHYGARSAGPMRQNPGIKNYFQISKQNFVRETI